MGKKSTYKLNDIKINYSFQIDMIIGKKYSLRNSILTTVLSDYQIQVCIDE